MKPIIEIGQTWRDKDRRREEEGTVRTFRVSRITEYMIDCALLKESTPCVRTHSFDRRRFGSARANDSFEMVKAAE